MATILQSYDDWLALSDEERSRVKREEWNAYQRDGVVFAYMAATRLAMQCSYKVLEIAIGTYHGGEYLLHLTVSDEEFEHCPGFLEQSFEGFRVVWFRPLYRGAIQSSDDISIEGKWIAVESPDSYEFEFRHTASGVAVVGFCRATNESLQIENPVANRVQNREYVYFGAYHPTRKKNTTHTFQLVAADQCEDMVTRFESYARSNQPEK